ncbi:MAG TPA: hypothetical protein VNU97_03910 [Rhizomicrobium sp.]|jgi:hypothetical protein|nr:hypothetical protein [Rhizomicrobium sp.]
MMLQPRLLMGLAVCLYGAAVFAATYRLGVTLEPVLLLLIGIALMLSARGGAAAATGRRGRFHDNLAGLPNAARQEAWAQRIESGGMIVLFGALAAWLYGLGGLRWPWVALGAAGLALGSWREIAVVTGLSRDASKRARPPLRIVN